MLYKAVRVIALYNVKLKKNSLMTTKEEKISEELKGCKTESQKKECKPSGSCKSSEKKS